MCSDYFKASDAVIADDSPHSNHRWRMAQSSSVSLETRFDASPHLKPGNIHNARPEFRPDCKQKAHGLLPKLSNGTSYSWPRVARVW
jgi:hypothetical protein